MKSGLKERIYIKYESKVRYFLLDDKNQGENEINVKGVLREGNDSVGEI
jgi:hypothetical protein